MPGVVRTRVGYAGGTSKSPTYHNLDDHSETIQMDYDPSRVSYRELLDVFWRSHNPTRGAWSRQYMSIIFTHNEEQKRLAIESKEREATRRGANVVTEIVPYTDFYLAEDYHQKYWLRNDSELMTEFDAMYPNPQDFVNSTAAARVNGCLGGNADFATLQEELGSYGLSPSATKRIRDACLRMQR